MAATETGKAMTFRRYGRSYHLKIETAAELECVAALDEAHWAATNAPISTINCDGTFLQLLDTDHNNRIMCHELRGGILWLTRILRDHTGVTERSETLQLDAIDGDCPEGSRIIEAAKKILSSLGEPDGGRVTLDQVRQIKARVEATSVSEVGVVLPKAAADPEVRGFIADVIGTVGGAPHPSGSEGIGQAQLDQFLKEAAAYLDWHERGPIPDGQDKTDIMPMGPNTPAAYAALVTVRSKIDLYFAQCEACALDESFVQRMGWTEGELESLDFDDPAVIQEVLSKAPLAKPKPSRELDFDDQINPYYADLLENFRRQAVEPVLGQKVKTLSARQWQQVKEAFAAHMAWAEAKPATAWEKLGVEKLRAYLDERFASTVRALIAERAETAFVLDNVRLTERLILYQAHMIDFANNFVSFPHLYDADSRAMFEMGTLVMDGRRFNLAVKVENRAAHAKAAASSNIYVLYVEVEPGGGEKHVVAVPATSGGKGNLCVGKRGIFYDINGKECDAVVAQIIDNPVALREALLSPLCRLGRLLTGKIESITTAAEKKLDTRASQALAQPAAGAGPSPGVQPGPKASTGGQLLGAGLAIAALGSAIAYITKTFAETNPLAIVGGLAGAIMLVMLPISIVAILKLRRRDLSAILEGSGWAVNARMRLTRNQARFFTGRPKYPKGARGVHRRFWTLMVVIVLTLAALVGGGYLLRSHLRGAAGEKNIQKQDAEETPPEE